MPRCETCMTNPIHPDKKCCFNCARVNTNCEVWHNCGEDCPGWDSKVKTNADRIRAMSDEELARLIDTGALSNVYGCHKDGCTSCDGDCYQHCLEELRKPYRGFDNE